MENGKESFNMESWLEDLLFAPLVDNMWKDEQTAGKIRKMTRRSVTRLVLSARWVTGWLEEEEKTPEIKRIPEAYARVLKKVNGVPMVKS